MLSFSLSSNAQLPGGWRTLRALLLSRHARVGGVKGQMRCPSTVEMLLAG